MSALLVLGPVVVTITAGRCGACNAARMLFVNYLGKTKCAGCAALERAEEDERVGGEELPGCAAKAQS